MISTISMVRLGKTFGNLMVDVVATNDKLRARVRRIVAQATGAPPAQVDAALDAADGDAKVAIVSLLAGVDADDGAGAARRGRTASCGGRSSREARRRGCARRRAARARRRRGRRRPHRARSASRRRTAAASRLPGFVDLQVNGFARRRLPRRRRGRLSRGRRGAARDRRHGVPADVHHLARGATSSRALARVPARRDAARASSARTSRARSSRPRRLGTHRRAARRDPDPALLERLLAAGPVRLMTLAPELPGALELDRPRSTRAASPSRSGTRDATAAEAHAAFDRGVRTVTHLFNAMRPLTHRDPGIVGAALVRPDVVVQVIVDGVHLAPDTVRLALERRRRAGSRSSPTRSPAPGSATAPTRSARSRSASRDGVARRERRRARRQRADDDRGGAQPRRARRPARDGAATAASAVPAGVLGLRDVGRLVAGGPPTSSSSTTTSRSSASSSEARPVSPPEARLPCRAPLFLAEIREQPAALERLLDARRARSRASRRRVRDRGPQLVRMVGHGSSDNAASYGVYAFGLLPALDGDARLDHAHRPLRHAARPLGLDGRSGSPSRARRPTSSSTSCAPGSAGAFTIAITNDAGVRARRRRRGDDPARGRAGARRRGDEDVRQHARRARAARRPRRRPGRGERGRRHPRGGAT